MDGAAVQITAFKKAEDSDELIVRLFEPTGVERTATLALPHLRLKQPVRLAPFQILTLAVDPSSRLVREVSLMEDA